jgi:hypothetical protein
MTGDNFIEAFLRPIAADKLFALIQSGYAADFVLELGLESISGLRNHGTRVGSTVAADPEFFRVAGLMREIQDAAAVGLGVEPGGAEGWPAMVFFFRDERVAPEIAAKIEEVRSLLRLSRSRSRFRLVASPLYGGEDTLTVGTRSVMQLLSALALGVEVPADHRERNLIPPTAPVDEEHPPLLVVHSGRSRPARVFVATQYEGEWFWIAEDDWRSKRTFTSILFLFSLASTGTGAAAPTITIPAQ